MNITAHDSPDVEGAAPMTPTRLERLFSPRSVAVAGASANLDAIGGQPIKHLRNHGFTGEIYPINPKYDEIAGLRCYPDIDSLPEAPDVLVIVVAARLVTQMIRQAAQKAIPFVVVFSSGFAEAGEDGLAAQEEMRRVAEEAGVRVIGPNCQGLMNISDSIYIGFGTPYVLDFRPGGVSMTSQSGALGNSLLIELDAEGVGFRHYLSTGNEAVTSSLDCIDDFLDDPATKVIAGYVEGFKDAHRLREIGRKALERDKPLVLWKGGNSAAGARAAASHTANLAGGAAYYQAAFRQLGIVGVHDVGDMADCVRALMTGRRPQGNRIGILTTSGGAGIAMADRCSELGLEVGAFSQGTLGRLHEVLPSFASIANPLDITADAINDPDGLAVALRVVLEDPAVDMLGIALAAITGRASMVAAEQIAALSRESDKPILVNWNAPNSLNAEAYSILADAGIPVYASPVRCIRGFGALWEYASAAARCLHDGVQADAAASADGGNGHCETSGLLNEYESKNILKKYGLATTRESIANDVETAVSLARDIGFPVVMKILSADIPHKSDIGGVRVNLKDEAEVRAAFMALKEITENQTGSAKIDGILVQEMLDDGVEIILGAVVDESFGPMVMFGAGGVHAEVFKDVAFRMAPLTRQDAEEMVGETRISLRLAGVRGEGPADMPALIDALLAVSALSVEQSTRLVDIDINPLFVLPQGLGAKAVDAVVRFK